MSSANLSTDEITLLIQQAQRRNHELEITGALMLCNGTYFQVLEGRRGDVDHVMTSIQRDPRHRNLKVEALRSVRERQFQGWDMSFIQGEPYESQLRDFRAGRVDTDVFVKLVASTMQHTFL